MAQIYCHCSSAEHVLVDRRGSDVEDLIEARDYAERIVRTIVASPGPEDWRNWMLHISDGAGEEIFVAPFSSVLGRSH